LFPCPKGKQSGEFCWSGEYYSNEVTEYLNETQAQWIIAVDKDSAVMRVVSNIKEGTWKPFRTRDGVMTDREIAPTIHLKEIKCGFGMERMPSGDFQGNAVHFGIGIMTYNLFIAQKFLTMPADWKNKTIKSIRWLLVETAGKLIEHGRMTILKIAAGVEKYLMFLSMRKRNYELMLE
jgi:hypothetical protein